MGRLKCLLLGLILFELAWADCPRPIIQTDIVAEDCFGNGRNTPGCQLTLGCQLGYLPSFPERYPNMIATFTCGEDGSWHDDKGVAVAITTTDPNMLACIPGCLYPAPNETSLYVVQTPPSKVYTFPDWKNNNQTRQWVYGGINFTLRCTGDRVVLQKPVNSDIMLADYTCIQGVNLNNPYFYSSSITNGLEILNNCQQSCPFNADNKQGSVEFVTGTSAWKDGGILNFNCINNTAFKAGSPAFGRAYERFRCDAKNNLIIDTFSETPSQQSPCVQNLIPGQCYWPAVDNVEVTSTTCENTTVGVKAECTMSLKCKQRFKPTNPRFLTSTGAETITCKDGQGWVDETGQPAIFIQCEQGCIREILNVSDVDQSHSFYPWAKLTNQTGIPTNNTVFSATCRSLTTYKKPPPNHPYYCADLEATGNCSMSCRSPQPVPPGVIITNKDDGRTFIYAGSPFNIWIFANETAIYKCQDGYQYPEGSSPAQNGGVQRIYCDWNSVMTDTATGIVNPSLVGCVRTTGCPIIDPGWNADITNATANCVRDDVKREYNNGCTLKYDCRSGFYPNETEYVAANGQEITCRSGKWYDFLGVEVTRSVTCQYGCAHFNLTEHINTMVTNGTAIKILSVNYTDSAGVVHSCISTTLTLAFYETLNRTQIGSNRYYCNFFNTSISLIVNMAQALSCPHSCLTLDLTTAPANPNLISVPANFTTELNQTYVGLNGTYEFECPAGKVVPGQQSGYKQKLICGPDSFFVNPETNEVIKDRNFTGLKACTETDICSLPNTTSTNIVITTGCEIISILSTGLKYNCTANITCLPGYFPVNTVTGTIDVITVICGTTANKTGGQWIDIKTGEGLSLNCTPGICPALVNSTFVIVTSNCMISNGVVTNNCTVTEQCKEGFFPVDVTGMTGNTRSSYCNTTTTKNSNLINIVTGTVLPPLNCTDKAQCEIPNSTTTMTNSTSCIISNGKVNYGCQVTEQCLEGYYPVNGRGVVNNVRTYNCTSFSDKNSTLVEITTGEILPPLNCTKSCANLTLPTGTILTSSCVVQKDGYPVGCNASLVCESGLQVNISDRITTVRNIRCDKIDDKNSAFIDILTGQPVDLSPCVCPVNITNSTIIKGDCIRAGQGGPPGCVIDKTCAPGTAPVWVNAGVAINMSLACGRPNGTNNYTWIDLKTGEASQLDDCHNVCPAVTVPNAYVTTTCTLMDGGYQVGCTATVECDQGFQGINVKYSFASKLNITCKGVASNNSTFIEITTGEPLQGEICGIPPTTQAPLVCKPINTTNVRTDSTCYIAGAGAPLGCQANVTCIPGTYLVYTNGTVSSTVTIYCNGTTDLNNKTWIEITTGAPLEEKPCWPPCPEVTLPGTRFNTSCTLLNGGFQVGCNATLVCEDYNLPINATSGTNPVTNLICKNHNNTASTWINIVTGEPVSKGPCAKPDCGLLNNTNAVVGSSCYYEGKGATLGCDANVTCLPGMYPVYVTRGFNTTDHLKCEKKEGQVNATWIRIETGEEVKEDECQPPCPTVTFPGTKFNSSCGILKDGGYQVGCNATLQCGEGYIPIDVSTGTNLLTAIQCKRTSPNNSVWINVVTGEPVTKPPCTPESCPSLNLTNAVPSSSCYVTGGNTPLNCTANLTCLPGMYPVYSKLILNQTTAVKCGNSTSRNTTWILIETREEIKRKDCEPPCPNVTYPGTKFNSSCGMLKDGGYQVGCNATLVCDEGYTPINGESGTNPVTNIVCKTVNTTTSVWVKITTGEPVTKPPCEVKTTTAKPTTLRPPEKCTWTTFEKLTQYTASQCTDPADTFAMPPIMYAYCNVSYACTNNSVSATYNHRVNMTVFCNKNSSTNAGTWIEVETGQPLKPVVPVLYKLCTRVCRELVPPAGTKQTSQTCLQATLYNLNCQTEFSCIEDLAPGTGTPPKNTAVCRTIDGEARWVDPTSNAIYVGLTGCPSPKSGCLPIDHSNTTRVINASCTPFPTGIHPENCKVDVECLAELRPVDLNDKEHGEHVAECLKNNSTGNYEWFDKTKNQWYVKYDCTKDCIPYPSVTASNTTVITFPNGTSHVCNFTSVKPGTGKYYCGGKDIIDMTCNNTCKLLEIPGNLVIGSKPELIKESVVPIGGQYEIYCPNGYVWKGTTSTSKKYTCGSNGKYTSGQETGFSIVLDTCEKPTTPGPNCTLALEQNLKIRRSSCDAGDLIYSGGCLVTVQCKNGSYPKPEATAYQWRLCDATGKWVDPDTRRPLKPYECVNGCLDEMTQSIRNTTTLPPVTIDRFLVVCTEIRIDREIIKYLCGNKTIDPTDPILERNCTNMCQPIGLDTGLTNTNTWPDRYFNKVIVGGITEVQCPPGTVFNDTRVRQKNFTCQSNGMYLSPNNPNSYIFVPNTCINSTGPPTTTCGELVPAPGSVLGSQNCTGRVYTVGCVKNFVCATGTVPPTTNPGGTSQAVCRNVSGTPTWFDPATNGAYKPLVCPSPSGCSPIDTDSTTVVSNNVSCAPMTGGIHPENCQVHVDCIAELHPVDGILTEHVVECLKSNVTGSYEWLDKTVAKWWIKYKCTGPCLHPPTNLAVNNTLTTWSNGTIQVCNVTSVKRGTGKYYCLKDDDVKKECNGTCIKPYIAPTLIIGTRPTLIFGVVPLNGIYVIWCPNGTVWSTQTNKAWQEYQCRPNGRYLALNVPDVPTVMMINDTCVKPITPQPNCTLSLSANQEVVSSSCDTEDLIYEGGCLVIVRCKNGTYPKPEVGTQLRLCDSTGQWVNPVTKGPLSAYTCGNECVDKEKVEPRVTTTEPKTINGVNVVCTEYRVNTEIVEYLCNNTSIDPRDPVIKTNCTNACEPIGLDDGLTNTNVWPERYYNKTIVGGISQVQCPPGTFWKETGLRQKYFTCNLGGMYTVPEDSKNYIFVPNTCTNETIPPTNPSGCSPIQVDPTTLVSKNVSCNPLPGSIHPENCQVHVTCLDLYHPIEVADRGNAEHVAECLKNPTSGNYEWFDKTQNQWWVKYKCEQSCLTPPTNLAVNSTVITWSNGSKQICNYTSVKAGTGKYYCLVDDIVTSTCNGTCPPLKIAPGLIVGSKPELIYGAVLVGGIYVVYCPNGTVWSTQANNALQRYRCEPNGRYSPLNVPDAPTVLEVNNTCLNKTTPSPNCTLILSTNLIVAASSCDTGDMVYEGGCLVSVRCQKGYYPIPSEASQERLCDWTGKWINPLTGGSLGEYKCGENCINGSSSTVLKNTTTTSEVVFGVNVTCVTSRVTQELVDYICNTATPKSPIVSEDCTNTCEPIDLDVGLTNTKTWPDRYHNKTVIGGVTQIQCPPGLTFKETGTRQKNYTCKEDGKYETVGGTIRVIFVPNTCVNETVKPVTGCVSINIDTTTEVSNSTCVPKGDGTNPEWCIVDVVCKNGSYPDSEADRNRSEHKVQCQIQNEKFVWIDLTLGNVLWTPYKCCNGCIGAEPQTTVNQTVTLINGQPQNCTVKMTTHKTGRYYCNVTDDVVYSNCTNVCPPLIVNSPLVTRSKPTLIFGQWVANGGKYEVYCNTSYFWPETGLSYKNYTCDNGTYTDGKETGILSVTNTCKCLVSNCTLKVVDPVIVEQINCVPSADTYEYGCNVILKCKDGYRPAGKTGSMAVTKYYQQRQCGNSTWIDVVTKQPAEEFTCVKDCIDQSEVNGLKTCTDPVYEAKDGVNASCYYCTYPPGLQPYLCPNTTKKEDCCDRICPELEIDTGLNKRRYATLIFTNKVALNDYYTVECPTGQVFKETGTRGQNYTCNPNKKYNSSIAIDLTKVINTCIDAAGATTLKPTVQPPTTTASTAQSTTSRSTARPTVGPIIPSCKDAIASEGVQDYNYTCGPINVFGDNCMVSFKCKLGYYPKLVTDRKLLNRTAKCVYPKWMDTIDNLEFKMFECIKGCLNETSSLPQSAVQTREITQGGKTLKCNVTTYLGIERLYYCNSTNYATVNCPETCPQLMVKSPLVTLVTPLNFVLNKVVLGGDKYIVSCPPGQVIEDRTVPNASSRPYTCDAIGGKYFNDFDEQVLEANFPCIPAGTGTCTLPQQPSTTVVTSSCPTTTGSYAISCVVFLSCPTGSAPEQPDDQLFGQRVMQCQNKTASGVNWIDLNSGLPGFKNYSCKIGCLQAEQTENIPSFLVGNTPTSCNISTIPAGAVQWQCPSAPALPDGTIKTDCSSGCKELQYKGQYFYVDVPTIYYHYVMFDSSYTFFCPPGAYFNNTKVIYQIFSCQKDGNYSNPIGLSLSTLDAGCTEIPQDGLGQKQNITITGPGDFSEDPFIGIPQATSPMIIPITPMSTLREEASVTQEHVTVPGVTGTQPIGELTVKPHITSGFTLGRSQP